jgi:hypothetical protein
LATACPLNGWGLRRGHPTRPRIGNAHIVGAA